MNTFVLILATALSVGALYYLLASGLSLIFGLMDVLSFAHGALLTVSAYTAIVVMDQFSTATVPGLLLAVLLAVVAGTILSWIIERLLVRPMYDRGHLPQILVTMGIGLILIAAVSIWFGPDAITIALPSSITGTVDIGGAYIPVSAILIVIVALALHGLLMLFLRKTRHGLIVRAGVENSDMVRGLGIDVSKSFSLVFSIGGFAAGLAGALALIYVRSATPHLGDTYLIYAFIVIVIGGIGSLTGSLAAAVVVGLVQQFANYYITGGAGDLLALALLAVVLLFRPQGMFGRQGRVV